MLHDQNISLPFYFCYLHSEAVICRRSFSQSAAKIHNSLRKDLCAYQKLVYNCELIRSMHLVVGLRHSCAECHAIFQMMNISAAAKRLTLALTAGIQLERGQQGLYKIGICRYMMRWNQCLV